MKPDRPPLPLLLVGNGIVGGMEQYVLSMIREMRARRRPVLVGAPFVGDFTEALLAEGFPAPDLHILEMSDRVSVSAVAHVEMVVRSRGVDLIHSHLLPADLLGAVAAERAGIPALSTLHGLQRCNEELLLQRLYGLRYLAVSEAGRRSALEQGIPEEAVGCIRNGVDASRFDPERFRREEIRASLGLSPDAVAVLAVTRLSPEKNPEGIMAVARGVAAIAPEVRFLIAGTGPLESKLRQLVRKFPETARPRLLGARDDVPALLAAADIALLTSRTESLPFAVLEAMAMGLPVVAYDVGGVREAVRKGQHGHLAPFGQIDCLAAHVVDLARDAGLRRRMGQRARRRVLRMFAFRDAMAALLEHYDRLVAPPTPAISFGSRPSPNGGPARRGTIVDSHVHLDREQRAEQVVAILERAGVDCACLIGPFIDTDRWSLRSGPELERSNQILLAIAEEAPERLWALVTVDPRDADAPRRLEALASHPATRGLKLIPSGWRPDQGGLLPIYEVAAERGLPILFHSGVFIGARHSDACRPALFEAVRDVPRLRIVLAHLGWPWVDEAIAVALMDPLRGRAPQIYLDTSPGTPPAYRQDALRKALAVVGSGLLLFGSDRFLPCAPDSIADQIRADVSDLEELGASGEDVERILGGNAFDLYRAAAPARMEQACTTI